MNTSEQINDLAAALSKAQGEITGALKDSANPFYKSRYADLASCWDACRAPLAKYGLSVTQPAETDEHPGVMIITTLMHSSGQWMRSSLRMTPKDDTPQAAGSAISYGRRYALTSMLGIAQVDDDGQAASGRPTAPVHEIKGNAVNEVPHGKAMDMATRMMAVLEEDVDEDIKALKVMDLHEIVAKDNDLYIAAADQMNSKYRAAWKTYLSAAKKRAKEEPIAANGRR